MARRCYNCNQKLEDSMLVCPNCGKNVYDEKGKINKPNVFETNEENKSDTVNDAENINKFALIGFILTLISSFTYGWLLWIGLILSIVGLIDCKKKNQKGKGFAIAGIVISVIYILISIVIIGIIYYFIINN